MAVHRWGESGDIVVRKMAKAKLADLIVLSADPLENISNVRKLKMVFKSGKLIETGQPGGVDSRLDFTAR